MVYDSEDSPEAQLAGPGPRLHHWGVEVDDQAGYAEKIKAAGGTILSKPDAGALKFRAPDGTIAEVVATGRSSPADYDIDHEAGRQSCCPAEARGSSRQTPSASGKWKCGDLLCAIGCSQAAP